MCCSLNSPVSYTGWVGFTATSANAHSRHTYTPFTPGIKIIIIIIKSFIYIAPFKKQVYKVFHRHKNKNIQFSYTSKIISVQSKIKDERQLIKYCKATSEKRRLKRDSITERQPIKCVFKRGLNEDTEVACLIFHGRAFHSCGAFTEDALLSCSGNREQQLPRVREGVYGLRRSIM